MPLCFQGALRSPHMVQVNPRVQMVQFGLPIEGDDRNGTDLAQLDIICPGNLVFDDIRVVLLDLFSTAILDKKLMRLCCSHSWTSEPRYRSLTTTGDSPPYEWGRFLP